ncbi:54S ribosomal protein L28, mitochondrial [Zancudomyces culisetae]|uniref:Large ribosomal subunit protein mL40 n=1 Tax=Zancudomyces culisetae TaxID=1213189 RepID=A0A1R1PYZ8_ZANCU|nr:54S ribosomal protein L28, mitochondrial [Zancudomyces culisetae]|eukprot:OMH86154.1 54S ribosomal protein L28, mitochondrial [Zancudomyces culisetae]
MNLRIKSQAIAVSRLLHTTAIRKAGGSSGGSSGGGGKDYNKVTLDSRHEQIKRLLFDQAPSTLPEMSEADLDRHFTIERARIILKKEQSKARREEREGKFNAMVAALKELENTDLALLHDACLKSNVTKFPLQLRVPTETPPKVIWQYKALSNQANNGSGAASNS